MSTSVQDQVSTTHTLLITMISARSAPWLFSLYFHFKEDQDQQLPATDLKCGQMCQRICECVCVCVCVCAALDFAFALSSYHF